MRILPLLMMFLLPTAALAQAEEAMTFEEAVASFTAHDGLVETFVDAPGARVLVRLTPRDDGTLGSYILVDALATGLGSNPVGLDRGQLRGTRVVEFWRSGEKVMMVEPNLRFRAQTNDAAERHAVAQSFAPSVLWSGAVEAEDEDGSVLVDVSSYVLSDSSNVIGQLQNAEQGAFRVDADRSAMRTEATLVFPDNIELEALVTYASDSPGRLVRQTAADGSAFTLTHHVSLVRLPDEGYQTRAYDPRMGAYPLSFLDYASALDEPLVVQVAQRHRLERQDAQAVRGEATEPIVYYVDAGTPEPVRSALIEGASWWSVAFEAAGFADAFRVEVLPAGAHPLDVRYNVIQWVHRSTRGWSYGGSVSDPRTGEILKGHVSLGSLRIRQDILLFEGLLGTDKTGTGEADDPVELALARIRQLAAHEVGHTLGLSHNFAASTYADRASVMDYPAPRIGIANEGSFDCSGAYGVGIGAWDILAIRHLYSQFGSDVNETQTLDAIVREGFDKGYTYITDLHARGLGSMHPRAHLWDNGSDANTALEHALQVRSLAMERFAADRVAIGRAEANLHEVFVPVYLHHRYQLEAAAKLIGGVDFRYSLRGDGDSFFAPVDAHTQREVLETILESLQPSALAIPDKVLELLVPGVPGAWPSQERFEGSTGSLFDPLAAASTLVGFTLDALLHPQRVARVFEQHRQDPSQLSLDELIEMLVQHAGYSNEDSNDPIQQEVQEQIVERMIQLLREPSLPLSVRAKAQFALFKISGDLRPDGGMVVGREHEQHPFARALSIRISRELSRSLTAVEEQGRTVAVPPGSPIGGGMEWSLRGCSQDQRWLERAR